MTKSQQQQMHQSDLKSAPRWGAAFWLMIAGLFLLQMLIRFPSSLNHDTSWFLTTVEQMQQGKRLYVDLIEVNPPLGIWMIWPIERLSQALGVSDVSVLYAVLFLLTAASLLWSGRILNQAQTISPKSRYVLLSCFAVFLLFYPGAKFAEREHYLIILFLPWLVLRASAPQQNAVSVAERIAIGVLAAAAVCMKPQSLLAPIAVEALLLAQSRNWRGAFAAENIAAALASCVYVAAVAWFTPEYMTAMVNLGKLAYYPYYGNPLSVILVYIAPAVIAAALVFFLRQHVSQGSERKFVEVLLAAALGFIASYLVQNKGFAYQALPAAVVAGATLAFVLLAPLTRSTKALLARVIATAAAGALTLPLDQSYHSRDDKLRQAITQFAPEAKSVFIASTRVADAFPAVREMHLTWASTFPAQWLTPYIAAHAANEGAANDPVIQLTRRATLADMQQWKPDLVLVDEGRDQAYVPGGVFDYVGFWLQDPQLARLWQSYEKRGSIGDFAVYTLRKG